MSSETRLSSLGLAVFRVAEFVMAGPFYPGIVQWTAFPLGCSHFSLCSGSFEIFMVFQID